MDRKRSGEKFHKSAIKITTIEEEKVGEIFEPSNTVKKRKKHSEQYVNDPYGLSNKKAHSEIK